MVLGVLHVLFFEPESERSFVRAFSLHVLIALLQCRYVLLEYLFVVEALVELVGELCFELLDLLLVLAADLRYHHFVICNAAVLEEDGEDFPYPSDE